MGLSASASWLKSLWRDIDEQALLDGMAPGEREPLLAQVYMDRGQRMARVGWVGFILLLTLLPIDFRRLYEGVLLEGTLQLVLFAAHLAMGLSSLPSLRLRRLLAAGGSTPYLSLQRWHLALALLGTGAMALGNLLDRRDCFGYASFMFVLNFLYYMAPRLRWSLNGLAMLLALLMLWLPAADEASALQAHILVNQIVMITVFAALAGGAMHGQHVRAVRVEQQLSYLARADGLTGLASRSHIQAVLNQALAAVSERTPVSIVLIDLHRFKEVNDLFGHNMGDTVLRGVARVINECTSAQHSSGRWGGEEFLVVCRGARLAEASALAERIRARLAMQLFPPVGRVTASLGVAQALPEESEEHLVGRADAGLYTAKDAGRDRVVVVEHAAD